MGCVACDLVPKTLRRDYSDLIADALVGLEVEGEFGVVPLDDDFGGLLDGLLLIDQVCCLYCCQVGE